MEPAGLLDHTGRKRRRTGPDHEAAERVAEALYLAQKSEEFHRSRCGQVRISVQSQAPPLQCVQLLLAHMLPGAVQSVIAL